MHLLQSLSNRYNLDEDFPKEVTDELEELLKHPERHWEGLKNLEHLPFVTIDNRDSRDLDQAMAILERPNSEGYVVYYALADASYFVRPGTALWTEAKKRGVTFYFPGFNVPMLPRALSEGLCSLNENEKRRALIVESKLNRQGDCVSTTLYRALISSKAKLSYPGVQEHYDSDDQIYKNEPFAETLRLLKKIGSLRIKRSIKNEVVRYDRVQSEIKVTDSICVISTKPRLAVESYNEQISLLCNIEGALYLRSETNPIHGMSGVYRVHQPPTSERLQELQESISSLVDSHGVDANWRWNPQKDSLADYVRGLPDGRLAGAIQRQALLCNESSYFSTEPGPHHGIGASCYARFSSPMREMVGVLTHQMAFDQKHNQTHVDLDTAEDIVKKANQCKMTQKSIAKDAHKIALDHLFLGDLKQDMPNRPYRHGTVLGNGSKLYVQLDDPPATVKVYSPKANPRVGSEIVLKTSHVDEVKKRWMFDIVDAISK